MGKKPKTYKIINIGLRKGEEEMRQKGKKQFAAIITVLSMFAGLLPAMLAPNLAEAAGEKTRTVYLSDLEWESATVGCEDNEIRLDLSYAGGKLKLLKDGTETTFDKGIGTHAASDISYNVKGKGYTKFEAWAGVDRAVLGDYQNNSQEGIIPSFSVLIDGEEAGVSGEMNPTTNAHHFEVEIPEDAERIVLHCESGDKNWSDHADWADARFMQKYPDPVNVALASKGTTSRAVITESNEAYDAAAFGGNTDPAVQIDKINDGQKDSCNGGGYFDFGRDSEKNSIFVEYDLKQTYEIASINMWRYWLDGRTYASTVIVVSEDPEFPQDNRTIIYNSDDGLAHDGATKENGVHGLGIGEDAVYAETSAGKTFEAPGGTKGRYIRVYTYGVKNGGNTNHIVELEVNAIVWPDDVEIPDPETPNPFKNASQPLNLEGPGTNNEVVHPDVVVFDKPWNGYKYWMGYTPNKTGTSYYENPCIEASNDEINWEVPEGVTNPVQPRFDSAQENENEHNCDTDLLYDKANDRLILYWEWAQDEAVNGKTHRSEIRYRVSYNGVKWGTPIEGKRDVQTGDEAYGIALSTNGERYSDLSPTFVYDEEAGTYKMWANDAGNGGYNNATKAVWYLESEDPLNFSKKSGKSEQGRTYVENLLGKDENGVQMLPWHQDIQWIPEQGEYWAVVQAFPNTGNPDHSSVRLSKSEDGIHWTPVVDKSGNSRAILSPAPQGAWDDGQIYRTTYWYEPAANGAKNGGTFHVWYSALSKKPDQHWKIGYTSAGYRDAMEYLSGTKPELGTPSVKRLTVDNKHPLLIMPLYGKSYNANTDTAELDWGDSLVGRWNAVPEDLKSNAIIELHVGGKIGLHESDAHSAKAFYENQLKVAQENDIPILMVVATAGQQAIYTGVANMTPEWVDSMFKKYSCLKGVMSTENYWTSWQRVADVGADYLKVAYDNGGFFLWSEHQEPVIEGVIATEKFKAALDQYGDSFIFTWKNTPANTNSNAGTASYMQGLWLTGVIGQWGGLADTWKWYEKGFGKLFDGQQSYISGGEEARPVATEPEALLGIEMMSIYTNGGCVYNFEHPAYVYGSYDQNSPAFENVVAQFMRYAIANPAPSKEEVLADTKAAFYGRLSTLKSAGNLLQQDINWKDATLPTQMTGRYGLIPAVPYAVDEDVVNSTFEGKTIVTEHSSEVQKNNKKSFFEGKYPETYTGTGFAQQVKDTWYLYNSSVNENKNQNANIPLEGETRMDVTMTPHTYVILSEAEGNITVKLNNYRVDKDSIWENYGSAPNNERWDTDHNTKLQDWVRDEYIPAPADDELRTTTFKLENIEAKPKVQITAGQDGQYETPTVTYDAEGKTATVTVKSNGYVDFTITGGSRE